VTNTVRGQAIEQALLAIFAGDGSIQTAPQLCYALRRQDGSISQTGVQHALNRLVDAGAILRLDRSARARAVGRPGYLYQRKDETLKALGIES